MPSEVTRRDTIKKSGQIWVPLSDGHVLDCMWVLGVHQQLANRKAEEAHRQAPPCYYPAADSSRAVCPVERGDFWLGSNVVGHVRHPAPNASGSIGHDDLLVHSRVCSRLRLANQGGVQQQKRGVGFHSEPGSLMLRYRCLNDDVGIWSYAARVELSIYFPRPSLGKIP